jgi:integrase
MGISVREKVKGSGIYWIFVRHRGRRVSEKVGDRDLAEDAANEIRRDIRRGKFDLGVMKAARIREQKEAEPEVPTLRDYYRQTLQPRWEASLSRSTSAGYDTSFRIHILPVLGDLRLDQVTRDRVKDFIVSLLSKSVMRREKREDGSTVEVPVRALSKESIRNIVAALRSAFTEAVDSDDLPMIETNPASRHGKLYTEAPNYRDEVDPFSADEVPAILRTARSAHGFEAYCILLTAFHSGLRAGEIAGLAWGDIDFQKGFIHVRRQFSRGRFRKPKTKKTRKVDMSSELKRELEELRRQRRTDWLRAGINEIPDSVFLNEGKPVDRKTTELGASAVLLHRAKTCGPVDMNNFRNRVFLKACDRAKIRRRRLHDTRHTFASLLLANGESLKYVQTQLGHTSIRMTADAYGRLVPGDNRAAVDRLPSIGTAVESTAESA